MPGYFQNLAFGGGGVSLKDQKAATDLFIGAEYTKDKQIYDTAANAKGLDYGSDAGTYKLRAILDIKLIEPIVVAKVNKVTVTILESNDNKTFSESFSFNLSLSRLNKLKRVPMEISLPSVSARYFVIKANFSGGGATNSDAITSGQVLCTLKLAGY